MSRQPKWEIDIKVIRTVVDVTPGDFRERALSFIGRYDGAFDGNNNGKPQSPAEVIRHPRHGQRQDPCVWDTFAAAIHQARTGEALPWWHFTVERKRRVAVVRDAIQTLGPEAGAKSVAEFQRLGARLVSTDEALAGVTGR